MEYKLTFDRPVLLDPTDPDDRHTDKFVDALDAREAISCANEVRPQTAKIVSVTPTGKEY